MPKPDERGSLMNLKTTLPKVVPVQQSAEIEERILGPDESRHKNVGDAVRENIRPDEHSREISFGNPEKPDIPQPVKGHLTPLRTKEGTVLLNAKIPVSLHTLLKRTAQYNEISMTDILVRGIESELSSGRYMEPPGWGGPT